MWELGAIVVLLSAADPAVIEHTQYIYQKDLLSVEECVEMVAPLAITASGNDRVQVQFKCSGPDDVVITDEDIDYMQFLEDKYEG